MHIYIYSFVIKCGSFEVALTAPVETLSTIRLFRGNCCIAEQITTSRACHLYMLPKYRHRANLRANLRRRLLDRARKKEKKKTGAAFDRYRGDLYTHIPHVYNCIVFSTRATKQPYVSSLMHTVREGGISTRSRQLGALHSHNLHSEE